jgi:outer membrane protein assembly factor BamA
VVRVEEAPPYRLLLGSGVDSEQGVRGLLELSSANVSGLGRNLSLRLRGAAAIRRAQLLLREPRPLGARLPTLVTTYWEDKSEVSFDQRTLAARVEAERVLDRRETTRMRLRADLADTDLSRLEVSPLEAGAETIRLVSLGATLVRDDRDDILVPSRGSLLAADGEWSSRRLGSEADYVKVTLRGYHYRRLGRGLVWAQAAQLGLGLVHGRTERLPLSVRYFAGGASNLRGLGYNRAGPLDAETGEPTGGDAVLVVNQELRFDLLPRLVGSAFADLGQVYRQPGDLSVDDLRWSLGLGLRYRGPVVAGFDVARLLEPRPDEQRWRAHFSLGFAF